MYTTHLADESTYYMARTPTSTPTYDGNYDVQRGEEKQTVDKTRADGPSRPKSC